MHALRGTVIVFAVFIGLGSGAEPTFNCPVPVSPANGQVDLLTDGSMVQFACDPGFEITGAKYKRCFGDKWTPEVETACLPVNGSPIPEEPPNPDATARPLFKWDDDQKDSKENKTDEELQADEARMRLLYYPQRRYIKTRYQRIRSGSELEDEEQKRSKSSTSSPPPMFIRRPVRVGTTDKDVQSDDAYRYMYYMSHYYDPRYTEAYVQSSGYPYGMALTESQLNWINSLQPEVRDKYLKDLYGMRGLDGYRAQAYYSYGDAYRYYHPYSYPYYDYYSREPLAAIVEDPVSKYDYSCYRTEDDGRVTKVRAPSVYNAYVHRYDRRQNPRHPYNNYLAAQYKCNAGYTLLDNRVTELYCSQRGWVGAMPTCVPV